MSLYVISLLLGAGLLGGIANALAGGATLITFPAMLATGLPPIIANASNAVAVAPGHFIAAIADRERIPPLSLRFWLLVTTALAGSIVGALLLLATPSGLFTLLVPPLIAVATVIFAWSSTVQAAMARCRGRGANGSGSLELTLLLGLAAIYGGYFGAGLGVMLMAVLAVTGMNDVRAANATKNILATVVSFATIAIFTARHVVSWSETLVMLLGAITGGFLGGRLVRVLPAHIVRRIVIAVGIVMTAIYTAKYWF
ncbi:MAG: sulfite exporter TauE/SafE family protein [Xanthobacteraceae bacterium]